MKVSKPADLECRFIVAEIEDHPDVLLATYATQAEAELHLPRFINEGHDAWLSNQRPEDELTLD